MADEKLAAPAFRRDVGTAVLAVALAVAGVGWTRWCWNSSNAPHEALVASLARAPAPPAPEAPGPRRVLLVVIDGLGAEPAQALDFGPGRCWSARVSMGTPTLSRPSYHVILTGVPQRAAGIMNNAHRGPARADTLAARVRARGGKVAWALNGVSWFHDLAGAPGDSLYFGDSAGEASDAMARAWREGATFGVLHLMEVDDAGHDHGGASPEYARAAQRMAAVVRDLRGRITDDTTWFVGADHGHIAAGGHGGPEPEALYTLWQVFHRSCEGRPAQIAGSISSVDLAPTLAAALGVEVPRMSVGAGLATLNGRTVGNARHELLSRLAGATRLRRAWWQAAWLLGAGLGLLALFASRTRRSQRLRAALLPLGALAGWLAWVPRPLSLSTMGSQNQFVRESLQGMCLGAALTALLVLRRTDDPRDGALAGLWVSATVVAVVGPSLGGHFPTDTELVWVPAMGFLPTAVAVALAVDRVRVFVLARSRR